jgi:hypothetical protein
MHGAFLRLARRSAPTRRCVLSDLHRSDPLLAAPTASANSRPCNQPAKEIDMNAPQDTSSPDIQGEGNYDATRRYDKSVVDFVQSGKVEEAARKAAPKDKAEADDMLRAEEEGKSHAKGMDSELMAPQTKP